MALVASASVHPADCHNVFAAEEPRYYEQVESGRSKSIECDVAVYGGTPAGVAAAMSRAKGRKPFSFRSTGMLAE